jgi:antitoxin YefM
MNDNASSTHGSATTAGTAASVTDARARFGEIVDLVTQTGQSFELTKHGRPVAVILGHDEHEALIETLNILSDEDTMDALREADAELGAGELVELD